MSHELLTPSEMGRADRLSMRQGPFDGYGLMCNAGAAIAALALARFPAAPTVHVLCGPGNNGGDGYVVARLLAEAGVHVQLWEEGEPRAGSDAARAAADYPVEPRALAAFLPEPGDLVVDALYGAGLSKPLSQDAARAARVAAERKAPVIAVDLPSGVSGESGHVLGHAFSAALTVTFARKKPGHLLLPGSELCGEVVVVDIGISDGVVAEIAPRASENVPALWLDHFPVPASDTYKYRRGHVGVFSGAPTAPGAARKTGQAASRGGAGAVTMLSPTRSLAVNGAHLTSIMLRQADTLDEVLDFIDTRKPQTLVYGPGLGPEPEVGDFLLDLLSTAETLPESLVLDADGLSTFAPQPPALCAAFSRPGAPQAVLTPH